MANSEILFILWHGHNAKYHAYHAMFYFTDMIAFYAYRSRVYGLLYKWKGLGGLGTTHLFLRIFIESEFVGRGERLCQITRWGYCTSDLILETRLLHILKGKVVLSVTVRVLIC